MAEFTIERVPVPSSLDDVSGVDFAASIDVRNASETHRYGSPELTYPADEILPHWLDPDEPHALFVARLSSGAQKGRIVARSVHEYQLGDESRAGWASIDVHPEFEHRGIGRALADTVEAYARELGEHRLLVYAVSPDGPGERLASPTGFGSVPASNREVRFMLARGYRLEQVERGSRFDLAGYDRGLDMLSINYVEILEREGAATEYEVHVWSGPTPERWREDLAHLMTRMSTDAPSAGLQEPEDVWTAARVAERDERIHATTRHEVTSVIEHRPTGRLVGFTQLDVPNDPSRAVFQGDTLVLREHRGHHLGMLLKASNLLWLLGREPGHPSVLTWNAEENRPMLDINERVGFVPIGYEGAWRLDL